MSSICVLANEIFDHHKYEYVMQIFLSGEISENHEQCMAISLC